MVTQITQIDVDSFQMCPSALIFLARSQELPALDVEVQDDKIFRRDAAECGILAVNPYFEGTVVLAVSNGYLEARIVESGHQSALILCKATGVGK